MFHRSFEIDAGNIRAESRTVSASLSSEQPVQRYDGEEVLSHHPEAVDLSRAPLPLLRSHNAAELPVGVVEGLALDQGKLRGTLRVSASQDSLWRDIVDGIVRSLSIGYKIITREKTKKGFLATRWMPYEVSLVAAPADNTVGIGRSITPHREGKPMDKNDVLKAKKATLDEMAELAKTGEKPERLEALRAELTALDNRLDAFELVEIGMKDTGNALRNSIIPDVKKTDRSLLAVEGGPAVNRSYAGMFNRGRALEINEEEIRRFRASMVEGVPSSGGASVPEPLAAQWLDDSLEAEIIRPRCVVWPMESATRRVPGWDALNQTGGSLFGGFAMEFLAEEGTGNKQVGKLRSILLNARKGAIFVDVSNELREDGQGFEAQLDRAMRLSIGYGMDAAFIGGSGAGQPLGIRNDGAKITVTKESGQVAATVVYENVVKMFARMYPAGRQRAIWLGNDTIISQLLQLSIAIGTAGSHIPVMTESNGEFRILGRPVIFTSHLPTLGTADDLMFVDPTQYCVGIRRQLQLERSNIPGWTNDLMSYRVLVRFDGMGMWNVPLTPKNGDTQSWCVGLGART